MFSANQGDYYFDKVITGNPDAENTYENTHNKYQRIQ